MQRFKRQFPLYLVVAAVMTLWTLIISARATVARADLRNRIAAERSSIVRLEAQASALQSEQTRISQCDQQALKMLSGLASVTDSDRLIAQVRQIAEINSLSVESFKTTASTPLGGATVRMLNLKVQGGFNGFYAGLLQIESLTPSLAVSDLRLDRTDQSSTELCGDLTLRLLLRCERTPTSTGVSP